MGSQTPPTHFETHYGSRHQGPGMNGPEVYLACAYWGECGAGLPCGPTVGHVLPLGYTW